METRHKTQVSMGLSGGSVGHEEWTTLITTMVPGPWSISALGEVLGGDPVTVIVRIDDKRVHIMTAELEWEHPHVATLKGGAFSSVPLGAAAARVAELINAASTKRLSLYRWCPRCHARSELERMTEAVCHSCAEKVLGIVF